MKGNHVETSKEAYNSLDPKQLTETYKKILAALSALGEGTSEEIAAFAREPHSKIWKRMSELNKMELVYRPGNKRLLRSGRNGFTWMLSNPVKTKKEAKALTLF